MEQKLGEEKFRRNLDLEERKRKDDLVEKGGQGNIELEKLRMEYDF